VRCLGQVEAMMLWIKGAVETEIKGAPMEMGI
jgi:hypothetical protein